ncbi:hypothetical protein LTR78_003320 [Recurvomyces mirabilis]|uniref:Uncharacterized protein n=1 Tax=Recurvomyces mirabilis TaxID=574656 RepID=A0AAE0WS89_9PEZI|nr:hypothetical protein LTR78_003320 [Recurvomyces mirabilis]KAK5156862.1 hypothetical protein LTS14_004379 [Recurvomyces mirabilis]
MSGRHIGTVTSIYDDYSSSIIDITLFIEFYHITIPQLRRNFKHRILQTTTDSDQAPPTQEDFDMDVPPISLQVDQTQDTIERTPNPIANTNNGPVVAEKTKKRLACSLLQTRPLGTVVILAQVQSISVDDRGSETGGDGSHDPKLEEDHATVRAREEPTSLEDGYDGDNIIVAPHRRTYHRHHRRRSARIQSRAAVAFGKESSSDSNKENCPPASAPRHMRTPPPSSAIQGKETASGGRRCKRKRASTDVDGTQTGDQDNDDDDEATAIIPMSKNRNENEDIPTIEANEHETTENTGFEHKTKRLRHSSKILTQDLAAEKAMALFLLT